MKKIVLFICSLAVCACQDDVDTIKTYQVKYEVITTSGKWFGEYIVETGEKLCTCNDTELLKPSGWKLEFQVKTNRPFDLHIDGTTDGDFGNPGAPDVTTNIYVNNKLVATNTSNWAPGVASADYVIK
jgi:hypothetical protein